MSDELARDEGFPQADSTLPLADDTFLVALRSQMLKFANLQLGDSHLAEDVVQEALAGALKNAKSFGGKAALKTWVFAILTGIGVTGSGSGLALQFKIKWKCVIARPDPVIRWLMRVVVIR